MVRFYVIGCIIDTRNLNNLFVFSTKCFLNNIDFLILADLRFNHPPNIRQPHSFRNNSSSSRSQTGSLTNSGPLNYCTIRRPATGNLNMNQQKRGVQFADQQDSRSNGQEEMVTHLFS